MTKIVTDAQGNVKKVPDAAANGKANGQKGGLPKVNASGAVAVAPKTNGAAALKIVEDDEDYDDEEDDVAPSGEKETYAQRLKKLPRHKRIAVKTESARKRIARFGKMTEGWSDDLKTSAAAAVDAVQKFVAALEALPADFVAPNVKGGRAAGASALAVGTEVTLTEKAAERYAKMLSDDGVDVSKPFKVTSHAKGKVGVKSADGSKMFFGRADIKAPGDAPF